MCAITMYVSYRLKRDACLLYSVQFLPLVQQLIAQRSQCPHIPRAVPIDHSRKGEQRKRRRFKRKLRRLGIPHTQSKNALCCVDHGVVSVLGECGEVLIAIEEDGAARFCGQAVYENMGDTSAYARFRFVNIDRDSKKRRGRRGRGGRGGRGRGRGGRGGRGGGGGVRFTVAIGRRLFQMSVDELREKVSGRRAANPSADDGNAFDAVVTGGIRTYT